MEARLSSPTPWMGALVCALLFLPPVAPSATAAENPLWGKQCSKQADGKPDTCALQQFVIAQPGNRQLLLTQLGYNGPEAKPRLLLVAPLGILLTKGISFGIDDKKPLTVPFETCNSSGCLSIIDMDEAALDQFRKGNVLKVRYYLMGDEEKPLDLPIKLDGLSAALKSIAP